ncbi:MAG: aminoacyl-tRNA hydrolase [Nitrospirota bacterium]
MKIVAGLGNPGAEYAGTRHNIGFMVVDVLAEKLLGKGSYKKSFGAYTARADFEGEILFLMKPQTYMNLSGDAVGEAIRYYKLAPPDLVVIHDDMDLPLGRIRIRSSGGGGGHRGVTSVISRVGGDFIRVRVGIGRPDPRLDPADYVLSRFIEEERKAVEETVATAAEAVLAIFKKGLTAAMNRFN